MIRQLIGDHIQIYSVEDGIEIRARDGGTLRLRNDEWRELVYLLRVIGEAADDGPA